MTAPEAADFFFKGESYCTIDLPNYFTFDSLLKNIRTHLDGRSFNEVNKTKPINLENVNYILLGNKDGRFSWRPFEIINPVIYTSLVTLLTTESNWDLIINHFKDSKLTRNIICKSIPVQNNGRRSDKAEQITEWWNEIEQASISLALDFNCILHADIANCYASIYTHSIPWALHSKEIAKKNRDPNNLLGNSIDFHLKSMNYGQTNGIPQGSVLMDFIAELLLRAVDKELAKRLKKYNVTNYKILRYRDDYRIFTLNQTESMLILKNLSEVLALFGLKLNSAKTRSSTNVVKDSLKHDKLYFLQHNSTNMNLGKHILLIHSLAERHPDSGSLLSALSTLHKEIQADSIDSHRAEVYISIVTDIMYGNPKSIPHCAAILSLLLDSCKNKKNRKTLISRIKRKFVSTPNIGLLELWLQRVTLAIDKTQTYSENLCKLVTNKNIDIWNNGWISDSKLKNIFKDYPILDMEKINSLSPTVSIDEVNIFKQQDS